MERAKILEAINALRAEMLSHKIGEMGDRWYIAGYLTAIDNVRTLIKSYEEQEK